MFNIFVKIFFFLDSLNIKFKRTVFETEIFCSTKKHLFQCVDSIFIFYLFIYIFIYIFFGGYIEISLIAQTKIFIVDPYCCYYQYRHILTHTQSYISLDPSVSDLSCCSVGVCCCCGNYGYLAVTERRGSQE